MRQIIFTLSFGAAFALAGVVRPAAAQQEGEVDPILDIAADMNSAALKLGKLKTDTPTQTAQQSALKKLDELIARLEEQRKQRGRGNGFGKQPAQDSIIMSGPGGMGALHADRKQGKQWGELPPKERERILQSMNDGFPSHYQKILERYFARLADEKPLADVDPGAEAAKSPAPAGESKAAPPAGGEKEAK